MSNIQRSQVTVPVGDQLSSIKDILEKVNLFSFPATDEKQKSPDELSMSPDPKDAYLGPKFWDKPITLDSLSEMDEPEFSVMNFNEFLIENDLSMTEESPGDKRRDEEDVSKDMEEEDEEENEEEEEEEEDAKPMKANSLKRPSESGNKKKQLFDGDNNASFLYVESKRARLEREAEERRRKKEEEEANLEVSFDPEELSLATIPGTNFDPRKCSFSSDDLKPQPIIRKRKKDLVPSDKKDDHYWEKRKRNNLSARRSREARRLKENQIALRASFLEKENAKLRLSNTELKEENLNLKDTISFLRDKLRALDK